MEIDGNPSKKRPFGSQFPIGGLEYAPAQPLATLGGLARRALGEEGAIGGASLSGREMDGKS